MKNSDQGISSVGYKALVREQVTNQSLTVSKIGSVKLHSRLAFAQKFRRIHIHLRF